ncbi:MAG: hypothetical protein AAGI44_03005 [Pseudomonadota bacterium]
MVKDREAFVERRQQELQRRDQLLAELYKAAPDVYLRMYLATLHDFPATEAQQVMRASREYDYAEVGTIIERTVRNRMGKRIDEINALSPTTVIEQCTPEQQLIERVRESIRQAIDEAASREIGVTAALSAAVIALTETFDEEAHQVHDPVPLVQAIVGLLESVEGLALLRTALKCQAQGV